MTYELARIPTRVHWLDTRYYFKNSRYVLDGYVENNRIRGIFVPN